MRLAFYCLLCVWLVSCGAGRPPAASPAPAAEPTPAAEPAAAEPTPERPADAPSVGVVRPPTDGERQVVTRLAREAERIRGLSFLRPVEVWVQDAPAMKQFVHEQIDDEELERARMRYVLLGLLDPELDIRPLLLDVMEEQLVGYYDPERSALAIRSDVADSLENARSVQDVLMLQAVILHELVHALQDQHFDLGGRLEQDLTNDEAGALDALVEGDATLAMVAYVAESAGTTLQALLSQPALMKQMLGAGMTVDDSELGKAPAIVREPLLFSYREGAQFVAELVRRGGWERVDAAHRSPPPSTGHILWPQRHLRNAEPLSLRVDPPPTPAGVQVEVVEDEVLGPYELGLFLREHGGEAEWARGWMADRLWQLRVGGEPAMVWVLALGDLRLAKRVEALLSQYPEFRVVRSASRLVVLRSVPAPLADAWLAALSR